MPPVAPMVAAWRHTHDRSGVEVACLRTIGDGYEIHGHSAAVESRQPWSVRYTLTLDRAGCTREARISGDSGTGTRELRIEGDGAGSWLVDGEPMASLAGCLDVDLEASALTNAFPVQRLQLGVGEAADAPAVYVRALDLAVERLEQQYVRLPDDSGRQRYDYHSPDFDFRAVLVYDTSGLVLEYPGIATRLL